MTVDFADESAIFILIIGPFYCFNRIFLLRHSLLVSSRVPRSQIATKASLHVIYLKLEGSQKLIKAYLHASRRNIGCLWHLEAVLNFVHGSLKHHQEGRLHVPDYVLFPQALTLMKVYVIVVQFEIL